MPAFAISEVAFPCVPPPLLDEAGPKMPQNAGTGEHSVSRGAGTSCRLQPPGHPCSTGGQAHQPGDGTHCVGCFGKRARPRAAVPSKGHMSPGGRGSLRATRMGTAWRKGFLFPLTPHNYPRQPGRLSAPLPGGSCRAQGVPAREGRGICPPKTHSGDSKCLSQLLGDSRGPFICSVHLTRMNAAVGLRGLAGGAKRCFVISPGTNSAHGCLPASPYKGLSHRPSLQQE